MKKIFALIAIIYCTFLNVLLAQTPYSDPNKWSCVFFDDFLGTTIDNNNWIQGNASYKDSKQGSLTTNDGYNTSVHDGVLDIISKHDYYNGILQYTTGALTTKNKYKYGFFEIRFKLQQIPNGKTFKGIGENFWLFDDPLQTEIDIFECSGDGNHKLTSNSHLFNYTYNDNEISGNLGQILDNEFHKLAILWSPSKIEWYVDEKLKHTSVNHASEFLCMPLIIDVNLWSASVDYTTFFPNTYTIDYVKVYKSNINNITNKTIDIGSSESYFDSYSINVAGNGSYCNVIGNGITGGTLNLECGGIIYLNDGFSSTNGSKFIAKSFNYDYLINPWSIYSSIKSAYIYDDNNISTTNIKNISKISDILISPNPNNGIFSITMSINCINPTIIILNSLSMKVYEGRSDSNILYVDISTFSKGLYFVNIQSTNSLSTHILTVQ